MLSSKFTPWDVPVFLAKYAWLTIRRRPISVQLEVTMRCNARCGFCDYWKTSPAAKAEELKSFADAARFFNPMVITFTGGEPTLRRDLEELIAAVHAAVRVSFITMLTHGGMLTPERGKALWDAGLSQINISLDYLDARHDAARGIPGLTARIFDTVPALRARGVDNIRFNTVIKDDNLDQILPLVQRARDLDCGVNLSVYTAFKNGNATHVLRDERLRQLDEVIAELLAFKRRRRGVIVNSDHYLQQIPRWARGELDEPCRAGMRTVHVSPTGHVKRCPDYPVDFHWRDYRPYHEIACNACFYACRGEAQAPLSISRIRDIMA
ncbi:MAG TPA: radical SAM protein [Gemmatimonadaceae bacterium]|nr:radical SAM protein [Gemmatimonadaceae bacterium]